MLVDELNKKLESQFGKDIYNRVKYRIVWSTSQTEKRLGTFEDCTESGIYLRTVTEVREVHKYPHCPDFWVMETIQDNILHPELGSNFSYEPLWVFIDKQGNHVQPEWWAIECIVKAHRAGKRLQISPSDAEAKEEGRIALEKLMFKDMMKNESPWLASQLASGHASQVNGFRDLKKES